MKKSSFLFVSIIILVSLAFLTFPTPADAALPTVPKNLSNSIGFSYTPDIAVFGNDVYVVYRDDTGLFTDRKIYFTKSTDGGTIWSAPVVVSTSSSNSNPHIGVDTDGTIFVIWEDKSVLGQDRIVFIKSTNGGTTWSAPVSNIDSLITQSRSLNSAMSVYSDGLNTTIVVAWQSIFDNGNDTFFSTWYGYSTNDGTSWSVPTKLSDNVSQGFGLDLSTEVSQGGGNFIDVAVVYDDDDGTPDQDIFIMSGQVGGGFIGPNNKSTSVDFETNPSVVTTLAGNYIAWNDGTVASGLFVDDGFGLDVLSNADSLGHPVLATDRRNVSLIVDGVPTIGPGINFWVSFYDGNISSFDSLQKFYTDSGPFIDKPQHVLVDKIMYIVFVGDDGGNTDILFLKVDPADLPVPPNLKDPPIANAGVNYKTFKTRILLGNNFLDGSASTDPDGSIVTYQWTQIGGPAVTINNANAAVANFASNAAEDQTPLTFQLTVTDNDGLMDTASVAVIVKNTEPLAFMTPSYQQVFVGQGIAADGLGSSDLDGLPPLDRPPTLNYVWNLADNFGTPVNFNRSPAGDNISFTVPNSGDFYVARLWVIDSENAVSAMDFGLFYKNNLVNLPPIANAGIPQIVDGSQLVTLDGTGSFDVDGTIASYSWTQIQGTNAPLSNPNAASPTFTAPGGGNLVFQLVVTDDDGASSDPSTVVILHTGTLFCPISTSGDWIINQDCVLPWDYTAPSDVIVQNGAVLTIPNGVTLDIDFTNFNLTVNSGGGVLIKSGGTIT